MYHSHVIHCAGRRGRQLAGQRTIFVKRPLRMRNDRPDSPGSLQSQWTGGGEESRETWKPARFGRGEDTLTDPEVRDTWEIPAGLVRATWDPAVLRDALAAVKEELGLPNAAELDVDLHSLLVYEPDQFFLRHQDTDAARGHLPPPGRRRRNRR